MSAPEYLVDHSVQSRLIISGSSWEEEREGGKERYGVNWRLIIKQSGQIMRQGRRREKNVAQNTNFFV